jgi:hypothetical protein
MVFCTQEYAFAGSPKEVGQLPRTLGQLGSQNLKPPGAQLLLRRDDLHRGDLTVSVTGEVEADLGRLDLVAIVGRDAGGPTGAVCVVLRAQDGQVVAGVETFQQVRSVRQLVVHDDRVSAVAQSGPGLGDPCPPTPPVAQVASL